MEKVEVKELLDAGVHFGHLTRKWNPNMAPYIYMERNGIHIINLYKTAAKIDETCAALSKIAASGKKILFPSILVRLLLNEKNKFFFSEIDFIVAEIDLFIFGISL